MLTSADILIADFKRFYSTVLYATSGQCSPELIATRILWPVCTPKAVNPRCKCKA